MAWDYCVLAKESADSALSMAGRLGLEGICILSDEKISLKKEQKSTDAEAGLLIDEKNPDTMRKLVRKQRKNYAVIAAAGRDEKMNRAVTETAEVDILIPGNHTKIDITMAKEAKKNNVRIAFSFAELLHSSLEDRGEIFSQMLKNAQSVGKAKAPFVIVSGAVTEYGLRSQSELSSFGKLLGFNEAAVKKSLSSEFINENRKRLSGKWIMPGVEVEK